MNVKELFDLSGKTALVTGGYTGIGKQMAIGLAEAGADVVISARNLDGCIQTAGEIKGLTGVSTLPIKCDVSKPDDVRNMIGETVSKFGKIDILVNNAGIAAGALPHEMIDEDWESILNVNLT